MSTAQWQRIAEHYQVRIEGKELLPGTRIPSDARLAEEWGVSRPTAHRALHELQRLGLVQRSKGAGTVVCERVAKTTGRVAFIVDRFVPQYNFPNTDLIRGIQDGLGEEVSVVIAQCDDDHRREARQLERLAGEVDGIIVYPMSNPRNNPVFERVRAVTPIVALDRLPTGLDLDLVSSDNRRSTLEALHTLVQRGHRDIGFFSFHKPDFSSVQDRHAAYRQVLEEAGVPATDELVRWLPVSLEAEPKLLIQVVHDALFALTSGPRRITALFCVEDIIAAAALESADCLELRVPNDIEIAFYNDWPPMMFRSPGHLHRIVQSMYGIGKAAASLLNDRIAGDASAPRHVLVPADQFPSDGGAPSSALLSAHSSLARTTGGY